MASHWKNAGYYRSHKVLRLLLIIASLLQAAKASAQNSSETASTTYSRHQAFLETIVVTGTRTPKTVNATPIRTEIITHLDISNHHAKTLEDALVQTPGVMLKKIHGKSGTEAWLQGVDADRILVLVDGSPVAASTGTKVDLSQIATTNIDHIEIVKGAVSALYGSSAMGGVINVITSDERTRAPFVADVDAGSYGRYNLSNSEDITANNIQLALNQPIGAVHLSSTISARHSDGFDFDPDTFTTDGDKGDKNNVDIKLTYRPSSRSVWVLHPDFYREDIEHNVWDITSRRERAKTEIAERKQIMLGNSYDISESVSFKGNVYVEKFSDTSKQFALATQLAVVDRDAMIDTSMADLQWNILQSNFNNWTLGTQLKKQALEQTNNGESELVTGKEINASEIYLQNDLYLGDRWELVPGVRLQDDSDFGFYSSPKINVMYNPVENAQTSVRWRAGVGRGYRVPSLKERYFRFDHSANGYMVFGNQDLTPEESDSYQFGVAVSQRGAWQLETNLFLNRFKDLILTDLAADQNKPGLSLFEYVNLDRTSIQGVEIFSSLYLNTQASLQAGYTYLESENRITGAKLPKRPEHQLKLTAEYSLPMYETQFLLSGTRQTKEYVDIDNLIVSPSWTRWDFKVNQPLTDQSKVYVGIDNLTNEHKDPGNGEDYRPSTGRFVYTGFQFTYD